jgi:hypothetical protein
VAVPRLPRGHVPGGEAEVEVNVVHVAGCPFCGRIRIEVGARWQVNQCVAVCIIEFLCLE